MSGKCGSCTACCFQMGIGDLVPVKPRNETCPHCPRGATGCNIYPDRPPSCRSYECAWLQSQDSPHPMPRELRPDRAKVLINPGTDDHLLVFEVDPRFPGAWRKPAIQHLMKNILIDAANKMQAGEPYIRMIVSIGEDRRIITGFRDGDYLTRKLVLKTPMDPNDPTGRVEYEYDDDDDDGVPETKEEAS